MVGDISINCNTNMIITWERFDNPKTLFPYCNQSLDSNERAKWLELRPREPLIKSRSLSASLLRAGSDVESSQEHCQRERKRGRKQREAPFGRAWRARSLRCGSLCEARHTASPRLAITPGKTPLPSGSSGSFRDLIRGSLEEAIAGRIDDGDPIPVPSPARTSEREVPLPPGMAAKAALVIAFRESGLTRVGLAKLLGSHEKSVRRMLDPHHNTAADRLNNALRALGSQIVIETRAA